MTPATALTASHATATADVAASIGVDPRAGLTADEAAKRLRTEGANRLPDPPRRNPVLRFLAQLSSPIVLTLVAGGAVAAFVGARATEGGALARFGDAIAIALIVLLNAVLGFVQEAKAVSAIAALRAMQAPRARVMRAGNVAVIAAEDLVVGDVIELEAGDAVPADARLTESAALRIDESTLTGESEAVAKDAAAQVAAEAILAERTTMLYTGTTVVAGTARALVVATGAGTELGKIGGMVGAAKPGETPLERHLGDFGKRILWACLAVTGLLIGLGLVRAGHTWSGILLEAVSFAVAIIPEGLPAVTTMTLAVGVQRMARRGAVVRRLAAVETLGSATVICTDKTGTLTQNEMTVREIAVDGKRIEITGNGYGKEGALAVGGGGAVESPVLQALLLTAVLCNEAHLETAPDGRIRPIGDPTEAALLTVAQKAGLDPEAVRQRIAITGKVPFDAARKRMSVLATEGANTLLHVKGSPDALLPLCTRLATKDGDVALTDELRGRIESENRRLADGALRVLGFAQRPFPAGRPGVVAPGDESDLTFLGLTGMMDPPRDGVREAIAACARAGVRTVMITGDHKATATAIARAIGIFDDADADAMTGEELASLDDAALAARIRRVRVFARVAPEQKLRIVSALKKAGDIVAMTGDGVNDAPALREAHIGVAMGRGGTEVARQAADIVLADDNFATLVDAIREGRAIYRNIQKFVFFLLSSNAGLALTVFAVALTGTWLPLSPLMILWINLVTNGLPALALGLDPPGADQMTELPRPASEPLLGRRDLLGIALVGAVVATTSLFAYGERLCPAGGSPERHRTVAFFVLSVGPLVHAWSCRSPTASIFAMRPVWSLPLGIATLLSLAVQALVLLPALRPVFRTESLDVHHGLLVLGCSIAVVVVVELAKLIDRRRTLGRVPPGAGPRVVADAAAPAAGA